MINKVYSIIPCKLCQGIGYLAFIDIKCIVCNGAGKIHMKSPWIICGTCKGSARVGAKICSVCRSTGSIPVDDLEKYD